jgi:hypothetical protein
MGINGRVYRVSRGLEDICLKCLFGHVIDEAPPRDKARKEFADPCMQPGTGVHFVAVAEAAGVCGDTGATPISNLRNDM